MTPLRGLRRTADRVRGTSDPRFHQAYSRSHESEADKLGLDLMARAGFNPPAAVELWKNMDKMGGGQLPEFLSTHPSHGTRISDLQARMVHAMALYEEARGKGQTPNCPRPEGVALGN